MELFKLIQFAHFSHHVTDESRTWSFKKKTFAKRRLAERLRSVSSHYNSIKLRLTEINTEDTIANSTRSFIKVLLLQPARQSQGAETPMRWTHDLECDEEK